MKSQLFRLSLCLASIAFGPMAPVHATAENPIAIDSLQAKGSIPFYRASEGSRVIALSGSTSASFVPLTFTQHRHIHSQGINPKKNKYKFELEKGSYQITFNGTFVANVGGIALVDLGIKLGSDIIAINTKSIEASFDNFQILNFSEVLHLDKKKTVQIVARNRKASTSVQVQHRSMSIIKIG